MKKINKVVELDEYALDEVSLDYQQLCEKAEKAYSQSHSPYSNFPVGASILLSDGSFFHGSNQENASYPSGLCAERVALFSFGSSFSPSPIKALAVAVSKDLQEYAFPCGSCLQVMLEYETRQGAPFDIIIMHPSQKKMLISKGVENLLPFTFKKENLS